MANIRHPNFIIALAAVFLAILAIAVRSSGDNSTGDALLITAVVLGIIHWIWSIIDVSRTTTLEGSQKKFWLIAVIAIPLGGMFYYLMHSKRNTIVD